MQTSKEKAYLKSLSKTTQAAGFSSKTNFASLFTLGSPKGTLLHSTLFSGFDFSSKVCFSSGSNVIPSVASLDITHAASRQANHSQNHYDDEPHAWVRIEREKLQKFACKRSRHGRWLPVSDNWQKNPQCTILPENAIVRISRTNHRFWLVLV